MMRNVLFVACFLSSFSFAEQTNDLENLTIEKAMQIALEHNHDIRLSVYAGASASASTKIASAAPNPSLTLQTANINPAVGVGSGPWRNKAVDSTVRIDQLIERGGKRELRTQNARLLEDAAHRDTEEAQRQLRISVSLSYYDLLAEQEKSIITSQTVALYDNSVAAAQKRLQAGDIASADVARLQVDALRAQNDAAQAEADLAKARQTLALVLGQIERARQIRLADSWPSTQFNVNEQPESWVERRPDVLAAKSRLEAAMAARKLALASRTRDISIGLQYEHWPTNAANAQGTGNSYGISVQIPLFVRNQFDGEIRAAEIAVDIAQENLDKIRDQARNELMASWQDARASIERMQRYDDSLLAAAKKSADAAEFAFKNGALGVMDVLDARRTYRAIQLDAVAARADFAKAQAAWQAAISESNTK